MGAVKNQVIEFIEAVMTHRSDYALLTVDEEIELFDLMQDSLMEHGQIVLSDATGNTRTFTWDDFDTVTENYRQTIRRKNAECSSDQVHDEAGNLIGYRAHFTGAYVCIECGHLCECGDTGD